MIARSSWDSLRALFEAALERPPGERAAFLRERIDDRRSAPRSSHSWRRTNGPAAS